MENTTKPPNVPAKKGSGIYGKAAESLFLERPPAYPSSRCTPILAGLLLPTASLLPLESQSLSRQFPPVFSSGQSCVILSEKTGRGDQKASKTRGKREKACELRMPGHW